uniref:Uncharacterized protein n=1 Tax=Kalanchoe fedtschenkoi TaxID=63787 RepID=A0A7N0V9Y9_KALFE
MPRLVASSRVFSRCINVTDAFLVSSPSSLIFSDFASFCCGMYCSSNRTVHPGLLRSFDLKRNAPMHVRQHQPSSVAA